MQLHSPLFFILHRGRGLGLNAIGCDLRPCLRPAMRPATCCHLSCHLSSVIIVRYDLSGFVLDDLRNERHDDMHDDRTMDRTSAEDKKMLPFSCTGGTSS